MAATGNRMDFLGSVGPAGNVLNDDQVACRRKKRGQCPTCGRKTHNVKFHLGSRTLVPLNLAGQVEGGKCLRCEASGMGRRRSGRRRHGGHHHRHHRGGAPPNEAEDVTGARQQPRGDRERRGEGEGAAERRSANGAPDWRGLDAQGRGNSSRSFESAAGSSQLSGRHRRPGMQTREDSVSTDRATVGLDAAFGLAPPPSRLFLPGAVGASVSESGYDAHNAAGVSGPPSPGYDSLSLEGFDRGRSARDLCLLRNDDYMQGDPSRRSLRRNPALEDSIQSLSVQPLYEDQEVVVHQEERGHGPSNDDRNEMDHINLAIEMSLRDMHMSPRSPHREAEALGASQHSYPMGMVHGDADRPRIPDRAQSARDFSGDPAHPTGGHRGRGVNVDPSWRRPEPRHNADGHGPPPSQHHHRGDPGRHTHGHHAPRDIYGRHPPPEIELRPPPLVSNPGRPTIYESRSSRHVKAKHHHHRREHRDGSEDGTSSQCSSSEESPTTMSNHSQAAAAEVHHSIFRLVDDADPSRDVTSLLSALCLFPSSAELQERGCRKIADWASAPDSVPTDRVLRALVRIADEHESAPGVQLQVLTAVSRFCSSVYSGSVRGKLLLMGGNDVVKNAMRNHLDDVAIHEVGCEALGNLFSEGDRTLDAVTEDEIDAAAMAMQTHPQSRGVQSKGCVALRRLTSRPTEAAARGAERSGGVEAIIDAMEFHPEELTVQECGLAALVNLSGSESALSAVAAADGVEIVAEAVRNHPECHAMCSAALTVLHRMCGGGEDVRRAVMVVPDAAFLVIGAMLDHPKDHALLGDGLGVLYRLSRDGDARDSIFNLGGVEAVARAMSARRREEKIAARGVKVFHRLFSDGTRAQSPDGDANRDMVRAVIQAMEDMSHLAPLQSDAVTLLWMLSAKNECAARSVVEAGGVPAILRAARTNADSSAMQEKCFDALHALAVDGPTCAALAAGGAADAILEGMATHVMERPVQEAGISALRALLADPHCRAVIEDRGGLRAVLFAMQVHVDDPFLQENALAAASNLLGSTAAAAAVESTDVAAVVESMAAHPGHGGVQRWACMCLYNLTDSGEKNLDAVRRCEAMPYAVRVAGERFPEQCAALAEYLVGLSMGAAGEDHGWGAGGGGGGGGAGGGSCAPMEVRQR